MSGISRDIQISGRKVHPKYITPEKDDQLLSKTDISPLRARKTKICHRRCLRLKTRISRMYSDFQTDPRTPEIKLDVMSNLWTFGAGWAIQNHSSIWNWLRTPPSHSVPTVDTAGMHNADAIVAGLAVLQQLNIAIAAPAVEMDDDKPHTLKRYRDSTFDPSSTKTTSLAPSARELCR